jgi:hypothetical protein
MCQRASRDAATVLDTGLGDAGETADTGGFCGQECQTELSCEIGVYDCSAGEAVCVRSGLREEGSICREATGSCDVDDTCDGVSAGCADGKAVIGSTCDGGFRDGRGTCGLCEQGAVCNPERCQEGTIACSETGVPSCEFTANLADNTSCGASVIGGFSACEWRDTCVESGEQSREIQDPLCVAGTCTTRSRFETMPCSRDREGVSCGDTRVSDWSACGYD